MKKYIIKVWCKESVMMFEFFDEETWLKYFKAFKKEYPNAKMERFTLQPIKRNESIL